MKDKFLSIFRRLRPTPFSRRVEVASVKAYTVIDLDADIISHVWWPRFSKHLAMAMIKRDYIDTHTQGEINTQPGKITDLPFASEVLNAATG